MGIAAYNVSGMGAVSRCYNGSYLKNGSCGRKLMVTHLNAKRGNIDTLAVYGERMNLAVDAIAKKYAFLEKKMKIVVHALAA